MFCAGCVTFRERCWILSCENRTATPRSVRGRQSPRRRKDIALRSRDACAIGALGARGRQAEDVFPILLLSAVQGEYGRDQRCLFTMLGSKRGGKLDVVAAMPGLNVLHDSAEHNRG